jgi:prepilin-type N-terminal cleavage/methylation domain-containing protein
MRPAISQSCGFTLLELMLVMVIIVMMTAFAVPALRTTLFSDQLKSSARKLIGLIAEASQEAAASQSVYQLHVDLDGNIVRMESEAAGTGDDDMRPAETKQLTLPESIRIVDVSSSYGGKRSLGETTIRFTTRGYVDKTLIHLRADDGRDMTIMLSPFLGVTRIYDTYIDIEDDQIRY